MGGSLGEISNLHYVYANLTLGIMKQILDLVHQITEDSATHVHAVRELLTWITVQVGVIILLFIEANCKLTYH